MLMTSNWANIIQQIMSYMILVADYSPSETLMMNVIFSQKQHSTSMATQSGFKGTWVAQSVKRPTLDFSSGHDLTVMRLSPCQAPH